MSLDKDVDKLQYLGRLYVYNNNLNYINKVYIHEQLGQLRVCITANLPNGGRYVARRDFESEIGMYDKIREIYNSLSDEDLNS